MVKGKLIVIEGAGDGIGKTTQVNLLEQHLKTEQKPFVRHHFPTYYAYQGKGVEKYLSGAYGSPDSLSPYFINSLYAHDRAITWQTKLAPAYQKGKILLLDRYTTSSLIYQSSTIQNVKDKTAFLDYITDYEYNKLGIAKPNQVFFLYAPFNFITKLRQARHENDGVENDIHEQNLEFMQKVYDNALFVAKHQGWTMINCVEAGGTKFRSPKAIHEEIYQILTKELF